MLIDGNPTRKLYKDHGTFSVHYCLPSPDFHITVYLFLSPKLESIMGISIGSAYLDWSAH